MKGSIGIVKKAFTGDMSGVHLNFKNRRISFVDFGEIRIVKKHEVDLDKLSEEFDCTIVDGGSIYIIRPKLLKKYPIQWDADLLPAVNGEGSPQGNFGWCHRARSEHPQK